MTSYNIMGMSKITQSKGFTNFIKIFIGMIDVIDVNIICNISLLLVEKILWEIMKHLSQHSLLQIKERFFVPVCIIFKKN